MAAKSGAEEDLLKSFEQETDAFFDQLLSDVGVAKDATHSGVASTSSTRSSASAPVPSAPPAAGTPSSAPVSTAAATKAFAPPERPSSAAAATQSRRESDVDSTADQLSQQLQQGASSSSSSRSPAPTAGAAQTFAIHDSDSDADGVSPSMDRQWSTDVPEAPESFTSEDRALREALIGFYLRHNVSNLQNVNAIVNKYRGLGVSHLWAQLSLKYDLPPVEGVNLLARTLYVSTSAFEYVDEENVEQLKLQLEQLKADRGGAQLARIMEKSSSDGSDAVLRLLCFRGLPDDEKLRSTVWKVFLGYLPMARHSEWNAIHGQKRALYLGYKQELLSIGADLEVTVREAEGRAAGGADIVGCRDLLQEIRNDVDRTRRDFEFFRRPATKNSIIALLYVYARLNPGVRYVQGMNEVAAVLFYVMSFGLDAEAVEADTFWCFNELMAEIKEGFMQAMDDTSEGIHALVGGVTRLLRIYDPELSKHLQQSELPPVLWCFRWCTLLFAQDATLPDVVRLWDSFIADPRRFEFVVHVALAAVLSHREALLSTDKQFALVEALQGAPKDAEFDALLRMAFAICAFERRAQTPPFPQKTLQVVDEISELAHVAAARAQEVAAEAKKTLQEHAPGLLQRADEASKVAASAAQDGAQVVSTWLQDTAPARKEAFSKAQNQLSSLWERGRKLAADAVEGETVQGATSRLGTALPGLSMAAETASSTASQVSMRAASAWAAGAAAWANSASGAAPSGDAQAKQGESHRGSGGYAAP